MRCTVCLHGERAAIDRALVAGEPERAIAGRFGLSRTAVNRHRAHIVPEAVAAPALAVRSTTPSPEPHELLEYLRGIVRKAELLAEAAEADEQYGAACAALREQTRVIGILMKVAEARAEAEANRRRATMPPWADLPRAEQVARLDEAIAKLSAMRADLAREEAA